MEEKRAQDQRAYVSLLESRSCSIEDEQHREVWASLTAAGYSFFSRWRGLIIKVEMPTSLFPLFSENM